MNSWSIWHLLSSMINSNNLGEGVLPLVTAPSTVELSVYKNKIVWCKFPFSASSLMPLTMLANSFQLDDRSEEISHDHTPILMDSLDVSLPCRVLPKPEPEASKNPQITFADFLHRIGNKVGVSQRKMFSSMSKSSNNLGAGNTNLRG